MNRIFFIVVISMLPFWKATAGELSLKDIEAATNALRLSQKGDTDVYKLNHRLSGCAFDSCENVAPRKATFEKNHSAPEARISRIKNYRCQANDPRTQNWQCYKPDWSGIIDGSDNGWFSLSSRYGKETPFIDEDLILKIFAYAKSSCFLSQAKKLDSKFMPKWVTEDFHYRISRVISIDKRYQIDLDNSSPYYVSIIDIKPSEAQSDCDFELVEIGGRVY
jgi:hypothetical protein